MKIKTFNHALRPDPAIAEKLACLPYDVMNAEEAAKMAQGNPVSFLHVERAEIDLPQGTDPYSAAVYEKSRENFLKLQADKHLIRDSDNCVYLYQQQMGEHIQRGLTALCHVDDYNSNVIKKHEKTRLAKENDRLTLNLTLGAHPGLVFLTVRDDERIDALIAQTVKEKPLYDFVADDGIRHSAWRVCEHAADWVKAFADIPVAYVADGHHRSAAAARVADKKRAENPNHTGQEDYNYFPAVIFPASQLKVLPYNRSVADLNGRSTEEFLKELGNISPLTQTSSPDPETPGDVRVYIAGKWYQMTLTPAADADPVSRLDVSMLQERVLQPLLAIDDPRTSERVDFIGGIRGTNELVKLVDSGKAAVAFSMYPVTIQQLMDIADADQIMPPKSTWFEPKLRSGLFVPTF